MDFSFILEGIDGFIISNGSSDFIMVISNNIVSMNVNRCAICNQSLFAENWITFFATVSLSFFSCLLPPDRHQSFLIRFILQSPNRRASLLADNTENILSGFL